MAQGLQQPLDAPAGGPGTVGDVRDWALRIASRNARMIAPLTTLIAMFIFFSLVTDVFLTVRNLQNVVSQIGPVAVAACGITFVLLCAEIDLSIASVSTFTGVLAAYIFGNEWTWSIFGLDLHLALGVWGILVAA